MGVAWVRDGEGTGTVAAGLESGRAEGGGIRLDGIVGRFAAVWAMGWRKVAGRGESGGNGILDTYPLPYPYLIPILPAPDQPNPTTRFLCKRVKAQYDRVKYTYNVWTIGRRRERYVCYLFIYIYIYIMYVYECFVLLLGWGVYAIVWAIGAVCVNFWWLG